MGRWRVLYLVSDDSDGAVSETVVLGDAVPCKVSPSCEFLLDRRPTPTPTPTFPLISRSTRAVNKTQNFFRERPKILADSGSELGALPAVLDDFATTSGNVLS